MAAVITSEEFLAHLIDLAVEAGADPERASERMRQAAQVFAAEVDTARREGRREGAAARRESA